MPERTDQRTPQTAEHSRLGTEAIVPLLVRFSLPAIVGVLVNALYNIVDRVFVGQSVGSLGIAAISLTFPIALLMLASSVIVGVGANALFAIRMGEGKRDEAEHIFGNAALLLVALPLVLSLALALLTDEVLLASGASGETLPMARQYLRISLIGSVFSSFGHGMTHFIRTDGHPRTAMLSQILGAVVNIALDAVFVIGMGMGVAGAAWATVLAQLSTCVYVLVYFLSPISTVKLRRRYLRLDLRRIVLPFMFLGLPHFAMQMASSLVNTVLNRSLLEYGGDLAVSSIGIVMSANTVLLLPMMGLAQGSQPIFGYNFGARRFDRVLDAFRYACVGATAYGLFGWAMSIAFAPQIVGLFTKDGGEVIEMAAHALIVFNFMIPVIGFQMITSTMLQSIGQPMKSLVMSLSRQVLVLIPLLFILPRAFGLSGVYASFPTSDFLSCLLAAALGWREVRRLKRGETTFTLGMDSSAARAPST